MPHRRRISLVALCLLTGCGPSVLEDPGVVLPPARPEREYDADAVALCDDASYEMMNFNYDAALPLLDEAIELDSSYYVAYSNKATILAANQQYDQAAEALRKVIHLQPHNAQAYTGYGAVLMRLDRRDEAEEQFRLAIAAFNAQLEDDPENSWTIMNRAVPVFLLGKKKLAIRELDRIAAKGEQDGTATIAAGLRDQLKSGKYDDDPALLILEP